MAVKKKYRVGVIGCGRISSIYLPSFLKMADILEVVYVVDKELSRAKAYASNFPSCSYGQTIEDLVVQDLDVVHVLTPHFLHKDHVLACLEAGIDVLSEKPIAITLDDAKLMCQRAKELHRNFGVIFQNRYIEGVQEIKRLYQEGAFGKAKGAWSHLAWHRPPSYYECDWKGSWEKEGGGVVIDQAIHSIDLVRYIMDCPVETIQGHISRRILTQIEVEDEADAVIHFSNGVNYAFFACNYYTSNSPIRIEFDFEQGKALLTESEVVISLQGREAYTVYPASGKNTSNVGYWGNYHERQIQEYYKALEKGTPVPFAGEDATKTLEIVLGIYQSSKENRTVSIDLNK
jgi:predicted dehydrogenase